MDNALQPSAGLGHQHAKLKVYIDKRPPLEQYQQLATIEPVQEGEILEIGRLTGNHWRKIFNVYAKLCFELNPNNFSSWQKLRDQQLLQKSSEQALIFNQAGFQKYIKQGSKDAIHIIMGRTFASSLINNNQFSTDLLWLNAEFAINKKSKIVVCPYFDYRQLSNIKISYLAKLLNSLK
ncbi:hypothetical protein RGQ13_07265 [Thalassotalea psychrophila]|uniref:Uncharacterized protein n=1 Tax=Thalassotalea psychrophila TaxID=3065647 RepID=A0ABY9TY77_9GAMM|nr:hypothetical protein RGQ13_07265 [Colwelliaceae bacterium SQ149]